MAFLGRITSGLVSFLRQKLSRDPCYPVTIGGFELVDFSLYSLTPLIILDEASSAFLVCFAIPNAVKIVESSFLTDTTEVLVPLICAKLEYLIGVPARQFGVSTTEEKGIEGSV